MHFWNEFEPWGKYWQTVGIPGRAYENIHPNMLFYDSTILDLDTPIRVGLVKSRKQHTCWLLATCSNLLMIFTFGFWPINLTLGKKSLPTVTSKAKLWPCQRSPRHRRLPLQNCLLGAMQKMEDITPSVTQKQKTLRSRTHENLAGQPKQLPLQHHNTHSHLCRNAWLYACKTYICVIHILCTFQFRYMYMPLFTCICTNCQYHTCHALLPDSNATYHPWRGTYHFDPFWLIPLSRSKHTKMFTRFKFRWSSVLRV